MEISVAKFNELRRRGEDWLYYIGYLSDGDDIIQNAFIRLWKFVEKHDPKDVDGFADNYWRLCLKQSLVDEIRAKEAYHKLLERYAEDAVVFEDRVDWIQDAHDKILEALPLLSAKELVVVLSLMENEYNGVLAARELQCSHQYVYKTVSRIKERLDSKFSHVRNPNSEKGKFQNEYLVKRTRGPVTTVETWGSYHPSKVEVVDLDDITRDGFWDEAEAKKVWPVTIIKGEDYGK